MRTRRHIAVVLSLLVTLLLTPAALATPAGNQYTEPKPPKIDNPTMNLGRSDEKPRQPPGSTDSTDAAPTSVGARTGQRGQTKGEASRKGDRRANDTRELPEAKGGDEDVLRLEQHAPEPRALGASDDGVVGWPLLGIALLSLIVAVGARLLTAHRRRVRS